MGLFDRFRRASPQPPPPPDTQPQQPPVAGYAFERDPGRMFDPERAERLRRLFAVARDRRDAAWIRAFWDAAWTAALAMPEPPVAVGPDGLPYARLDLPDAPTYEANSLMNVAASLVEQGVGAALYASSQADMEAAEYVIPMGVLDSILRYDHPEGEPAEIEETADPPPGGWPSVVKAGERVMIGTPSEQYLSKPAARALYRHLTDGWRLADPGVALFMAPSLRPSRSLVIGKTRAEFAAEGVEEEMVQRRMQMLRWHLPPSRSLMLMPDDWSQGDMTPLRELL